MRCRTGLALLVAALGWAQSLRAVEMADSTFCGDDHYFVVAEPVGWVAIEEPEGMSSESLGLGRSFGSRPPDGTPGAEGVSLVTRVLPSPYRAPDSDPRDVLAAALDLLTLTGAEFSELTELKLAHPAMPSAGVRIEVGPVRFYVVAVAVPRAGGSAAIFTLTTSGEASPEQLGILQTMLASFRYDGDAACHPDADGVAQKQPFERSPWREDPRNEAMRAADQRSTASLGYSPLRAAQACAVRAQLMVPVDCHPAELEGKPVFLVDTHGVPGMPRTPDELAWHGRQIALRWCFETRAASAAPRLVFTTDEADRYQSFDCKAMRLGAAFRGRLAAPAAPR